MTPGGWESRVKLISMRFSTTSLTVCGAGPFRCSAGEVTQLTEGVIAAGLGAGGMEGSVIEDIDDGAGIDVGGNVWEGEIYVNMVGLYSVTSMATIQYVPTYRS